VDRTAVLYIFRKARGRESRDAARHLHLEGIKLFAPIIGFFEVLIWLFAIRQVMNNLSNPACFVAYAMGFSLGNLIGMLIEEKISLGYAIVRVITPHLDQELVDYLRSLNYGITVTDGSGSEGQVKIIFSALKRKEIASFVEVVKRYDPGAFYTVEDLRFVSKQYFSPGFGFKKIVKRK
jgi:uncharacterized protein YebE (UPF0316 family)